MAKWKLCFVLLLMLTVCFAGKVTLVKNIGREPDATPICSNATLSTIILIWCKIRPERSGEECRLQYRYGEDFVHECDSRFTLMMENQTVFLHLTSLTPVDSGNYTCECSHRDGTDTLHLNITVEDNILEEEVNSTSTIVDIYSFWIVVTIVTIVTIVITGVIFGFVCRRIRHGCSRPTASGSSVCETPGSLDKDDPDDPDDPYTSPQHPASDHYRTISNSASSRPIVTACLNNQEIDGREADPSCEIYENI